jgi:acyl dehydratase
MSIPVKQRYFEDYSVGEVMQYGDYLITEEEIITFASRYDPQAFHIDPVAAKDSSFGGLVASGWMTGSITMRLMVEHFISPVSSMGSPGLDDIRWLRPVRPGDRLSVRTTVLEARRSQSKPDRGVIQVLWETLNQQGDLVMSMKGYGMYRCRTTG